MRNLIAYAVQPAIIYPTHYVGDQGYVTDTEHTDALEPTKFTTDGTIEQENQPSAKVISDKTEL